MKIFAACIAMVLAGFVTPGLAQVKNSVIHEADSLSFTGEPSLAINPRNPLIIAAASAPDNIFNSIDGGKTWRKEKIMSPSSGCANPMVASDNKGTFYLIHTSGETQGTQNENTSRVLISHVSYDGGKTWDVGTPLGISEGKAQVKPTLSLDPKGNLWASWVQFDKYTSTDSSCRSSLMISSSSNGKKWSKPFELSQLAGDCSNSNRSLSASSIAVSDDKKVYATWSNQKYIFLDRSFDGGSMWLTNDIAVSDQKSGWNLEIPGCDRANGMPVLMLDKTKSDRRGLIFLVWADQKNDRSNTDIWFGRSNNFGDIWTPALKINDDVEKRHQFMPTMAVDNLSGHIFILYYDRRNYTDNRTDVYLAYSRDSGTTFKNIKISETPFIFSNSFSHGRGLTIDSHNGVITMLWTRADKGKNSLVMASVKDEELPK